MEYRQLVVVLHKTPELQQGLVTLGILEGSHLGLGVLPGLPPMKLPDCKTCKSDGRLSPPGAVLCLSRGCTDWYCQAGPASSVLYPAKPFYWMLHDTFNQDF